ncbi:hypothetical protein Tco_0731027 [Tanacetum coccineum]
MCVDMEQQSCIRLIVCGTPNVRTCVAKEYMSNNFGKPRGIWHSSTTPFCRLCIHSGYGNSILQTPDLAAYDITRLIVAVYTTMKQFSYHLPLSQMINNHGFRRVVASDVISKNYSVLEQTMGGRARGNMIGRNCASNDVHTTDE